MQKNMPGGKKVILSGCFLYRKFINRLAVAEFDVNVDVNYYLDENTAKLKLSLTLSSALLLRSMPPPTDL